MVKTGKTLMIKDAATLKVMADPLRAQIFEALVAEPLTVKRVAEKLGLAPGKLYYHFNLLQRSGLIHVSATRKVANMVESVYQASADELQVDCCLLKSITDEGKDSLLTLAVGQLDTTREDLLRSLQARFQQIEEGAPQHPRLVNVRREVRHIPDERAKEFCTRLSSLVEEFCTAEVPVSTPGSMPYAMTVALYPIFHFDAAPGASEKKET